VSSRFYRDHCTDIGLLNIDEHHELTVRSSWLHPAHGSTRHYWRWKDLSLLFFLEQGAIILTSQKECAYSCALQTRDNEMFPGLFWGSDFKINFSEENKRYISW